MHPFVKQLRVLNRAAIRFILKNMYWMQLTLNWIQNIPLLLTLIISICTIRLPLPLAVIITFIPWAIMILVVTYMIGTVMH